MDIRLTVATYAVIIACILSIVLSPLVIPFLVKLKLGQNVRSDGPQSHLSKAGTPSMGGIIILTSALLTSLFFLRQNNDGIIVLFLTLGFGIIGFFDDYIKVIKKRSLGLKAYQKIIGQLLVTAVFIAYLMLNNVDFFNSPLTKIIIPFTDGAEINLGLWWIPFVFLVVIGSVNAVNLTDGLDGLASGVTVLVSTFFIIMAWAMNSEILPVTAAVAGSLLGFLLFNSYPAKVFMGDTGSLALGGFIAAVAIILRLPVFLLIVGIVYVVEACSVIIQVLYFKKTGKRFFKMAPIHHSFELSGWSETKVVTFFCILTTLACLIGFLAASHII